MQYETEERPDKGNHTVNQIKARGSIRHTQRTHRTISGEDPQSNQRSVIYKLRQGADVFELNDGLMAVEEFAKLESRQMFFVCLCADPSRDNPVGTLSGRERREQAARIAGYKMEADGRRLDKNGRLAVTGQIKSIETAIERFKELHYNERQRSIEALKKQISEIRDFLEADKKIPLIHKGKIVVDASGEEVSITDQKALKLAVELGQQLPELEEALDKLVAANKTDDTKFEGTTYTAIDLDPTEHDGGEDIPAIELFHMNQQRND